jgi:hypothetical protein
LYDRIGDRFSLNHHCAKYDGAFCSVGLDGRYFLFKQHIGADRLRFNGYGKTCGKCDGNWNGLD